MTEYMEDEKREGIKYEYHVSYINIKKERESTSPFFTQNLTFGSIVARPTDLRGVELTDWLREIIAKHEKLGTKEIVIIAISEIGSYIYEID